MTSIPSDINLIINKLSTIDKGKDNETNENIVKESGNDKENIIEESGGYSLIGNDNKHYVQLYNKFWPYRALKIINWILFLLLFVGSILTTAKPLRWAKNYWPSIPPYNDFDICGLIAMGQLVLAIMGLIALIVHCFAKDLFKAALSSLMDMCFFIFSVVILVISTTVFSLKTISLYCWLRPKLANFNYTLEAYADITEIDMRKHKEWGLEGYTLDLIESHKEEIIINVLINPIMTVLTAVTLILNIFMIFCLYKKMRNAKLWNDGVKDYLALFPKCSPIEIKYAHLGKTKMFQWLLPLSPLLAYIYIPIFRNDRHTSVRYFWAPTIIYSIDWLLYYTTIHLRYPKGQTDKAIKLSYIFFTDLILSFFFTILFIICAVTMGNDFENIFFIILIIFYGCYSLMLSFIYLRNKKGSFNFKLPTSIKINFEINLKSGEEENKVIGEKLEEGDEKKKMEGRTKNHRS